MNLESTNLLHLKQKSFLNKNNNQLFQRKWPYGMEQLLIFLRKHIILNKLLYTKIKPQVKKQ